DVDQHAVCVGFVVVVDVARQHGAVGGRLALVEVRLGAGKATVYALAGADAKADVAIGAGGRHIDTARDADFTAARAGERVLQVGVGIGPARAVVRAGGVVLDVAGRRLHL